MDWSVKLSECRCNDTDADVIQDALMASIADDLDYDEDLAGIRTSML